MNSVSCKPLTVLVVDDSDAIRTRLCELLCESPRLRVVGEACDGEEALTWPLHEEISRVLDHRSAAVSLRHSHE